MTEIARNFDRFQASGKYTIFSTFAIGQIALEYSENQAFAGSRTPPTARNNDFVAGM
jgi:hypothetical protein